MLICSHIFLSKRLSGKVLAFTLIELLAVVSIVGILAALLIPVGSSFLQRASGVTCANNMRQVASALMAYRGEHNGWFPPGYPASPSKIEAGDQQPGQPPQSGVGQINFNKILVPGYLDELPVCPLIKMLPEQRERRPSAKKFIQSVGGTYGINGLLLQWKMEGLPWPGWPLMNYSASRMPFLLEIGGGSTTWSFEHQEQALTGVRGWGTMGRNHGRGDMLNFMFLDGHMEMISRNDTRDISSDRKSWIFPTNPNGRFNVWGSGGRFITPSQMANNLFKQAYPRFFPPSPEP